jgi:hypothetical protein
MKENKSKPNVSIRIDPEALHRARIDAVRSKKTLGAWLEEAINEKIAKGRSRPAGDRGKKVEEKKIATSQVKREGDKRDTPSLISLIKQRR